MSYNPLTKKPHVTAVMAITLNGLLTRGDEPGASPWTSSADKKFFSEKMTEAKSLVMGVTTFLAENPAKQPVRKDRFSVVLAHSPEDFADYALEGVREFWNKSAKEVVEEFAKRGFAEVTLIGGGKVNAQFFADGLVDELFLTIEPLVFGQGRPLIDSANMFEANFRLESFDKLNDNGTLLLHYRKR